MSSQINLLLCETELKDEISNYVNVQTEILYFNKDQSYEDLLSTVQNTVYTNIGIVSHGNSDYFNFVKRIHTRATNGDFINFLKDLKTKTSLENLDLLSCFTGSNIGFVQNLETETGINVRASTDITGNEPLGDWDMETDGVNVKLLYFTESISESKILLYIVSSFFGNYGNHVINKITDVTKTRDQIYPNYQSFAALKDDGSVVTWGAADYGGDSSGVKDSNGNVNTGALTSDVVKIYSTIFAFAALKSDGSVVTWGSRVHGGDKFDVGDNFDDGNKYGVKKADGTIDENALAGGVVQIYSVLDGAFAALKSDGSVVTWGDDSVGGDKFSQYHGVKNANDTVDENGHWLVEKIIK